MPPARRDSRAGDRVPRSPTRPRGAATPSSPPPAPGSPGSSPSSTGFPPGTTYQLFCTFTGPHSPQPGWGPGTRASTDGLRSIIRHPRPRPARLGRHALPAQLRTSTHGLRRRRLRQPEANLEITNDRTGHSPSGGTTTSATTSRAEWDLDDDFLTGSYRRDTKTKKLKDIDIFVVIDPDGAQAGCGTSRRGPSSTRWQTLLRRPLARCCGGRDGLS